MWQIEIFYWFNSFNWIICSRRLFSAFCRECDTTAEKQKKKRTQPHFLHSDIFTPFNPLKQKANESSRFWSRKKKMIGKLKMRLNQRIFFSFFGFVRWGETSMSSCDSNVLGQTARSTLICFTVFARHIGFFSFILFLHIINEIIVDVSCENIPYTPYTHRLPWTSSSVDTSVVVVDSFFSFSTVHSFHLKQQRAAAYIHLKRERIDGRTKN